MGKQANVDAKPDAVEGYAALVLERGHVMMHGQRCLDTVLPQPCNFLLHERILLVDEDDERDHATERRHSLGPVTAELVEMRQRALLHREKAKRNEGDVHRPDACTELLTISKATRG